MNLKLLKSPLRLLFPDKEDGHIDFIEVKTGTRSRLSDDQVGLKKIIKDKHINFIKLKVDTIQDEDTIK